MDEKDYLQSEGEHDDTIDEYLEMPEEEEASAGSKRSRPVFKMGAVVILLAFIAFAYAWLPFLWPPHLDFLQQDQALSEEDLVLRCKPAVVNIQAKKTGDALSSQGTGINLEAEGMIITNRHVVEGAESVKVSFSDEKSYFSRDLEIIDGYDLAMIKLKAKDLPFVAVETEQLVELGQIVTIIGNPRGFQRISSRGEVKEYFESDSGMPAFTINATIAPGSSGSPVLDEKGCLVGIIFAIGTVKLNGEEQERALAIPATALNYSETR